MKVSDLMTSKPDSATVDNSGRVYPVLHYEWYVKCADCLETEYLVPLGAGITTEAEATDYGIKHRAGLFGVLAGWQYGKDGLWRCPDHALD